MAHQLAVGALVDVVLGLPGAPRRDGVVDPRADAIGGGRLLRRAVLGGRPPQREAVSVARAHPERSAHRGVLDLQRHGAAHGDAAGAERARAAVLEPDQRPDQPVLGPRREFHDHLHVALDALDGPQHLMRRIEAQVVAALALGGRHHIDQPHRPGVRREGGLDRQRPGDVAADGVERAGRTDRPVPGVRVQQPREDRRAVVARHAQPVDRARAVHQRGAVAVGQ